MKPTKRKRTRGCKEAECIPARRRASSVSVTSLFEAKCTSSKVCSEAAIQSEANETSRNCDFVHELSGPHYVGGVTVQTFGLTTRSGSFYNGHGYPGADASTH
jgi:hypothetical protein